MSLPDPTRHAPIVAALVQGDSLRSTSRTTGVAKAAVLALLVDLGAACRAYHDRAVRRLPCNRIECDAIGASRGAGGENRPGARHRDAAAASLWTWTALCVDTRLLASFHVGARDADGARDLVADVASRLTSRVQLTTDGRKAYLDAVEDASSDDVDHALLVKLYGEKRAGKARQSPAKGHLEHAVALHVMHHNFVAIHPALHVTPAMAAGVADRPWSIEDLLALLPEPTVAARQARKPGAQRVKGNDSAHEHAGTLPAETSTFFARRAELDDLRRRFEGGARLVTVGGPPGVGKTRLVRRHGRLEAEAAGDAGGVRLCDLSHAGEPARLVAAIARAIGLQLPSSRTLEAAAEQLGHALAARGRTLIILDNLEVLAAEAAPVLAALLSLAPSLRLLVSSREPVHLDGEARLVLGPLDTDDAAALFEDRAALTGAALAASDRPVVREIVRRLDGLPLAVELAAARTNVLPPQMLLARLSARLDFLVQTRRDAPVRHAGLRAAIDGSWELLTPSERDAFAELSVFRGGCSLEAAEAVLSAGEPSVLDRLQSLVERSLVTATRSALDMRIRFFMLHTIREYADEKLDPPRRDELARRHAEWCVRMAEPLAEATSQPSAPEALARLSAESDNLLAALRNMRGRSPDLVARAALGLDAWLTVRGPLPQRDALLSEALDSVAADAGARGRLLCARGDARRLMGRMVEARSDLGEARQLALAATELQANVELGLGRLAVREHRHDDARSHCEGAMRLHRARGDRAGAARARVPLCAIHIVEGRYGEALDGYREVLTDARATGDLGLQAFALLEMGTVLAELGRADEAEVALEEACAICSRLDDPGVEMRVQINRGNLCLEAGRLPEARAAYERTVTLGRTHGDVLLEGAAELNLGLAGLDSGAAEEARTHLVRAMALLDGRGYAMGAAVARTLLASADACTDRSADAEAGFADARARLEALAEPRYSILADVLEGLLDVARAKEAARAGDSAGADRWRQRALGRLEVPSDTPPSLDLRVALRVLERALAHPRGVLVDAPSTVVRVAADGRWFQLPGGRRVDLSRQRALRCLLHALAEQRLLAPSQPLSAADLVARTWPGEKLISRSGPTRLYTALATLRRLGLRKLLLTRSGGYLLDPEMPVERGATEPAQAPQRTPRGK